MATTVIKTTIPKLVNALERYKDVSRKSWAVILVQESVQWGYALYDACNKISPDRGRIWADASTRGYRMGRKGDDMTESARGISAASWKRAKKLLEGQKSDLFRVNLTAGSVQLRRVRYSAKKSAKFLIGGRYGNKFAEGSRRFGQLKSAGLDYATHTRIRREIHDLGLKRLNERAVATAIEISYRTRAGKGFDGGGGLMAVQWLPKISRRQTITERAAGAAQDFVRNTLHSRQEIGRVRFHRSRGDIVGVSIIGSVPGSTAVLGRHGIIDQVEALRAADREAYIQRKVEELHAATLENQ